MECCISEQAALEEVVYAIEGQVETLEQDLARMHSVIFRESHAVEKPNSVPIEDEHQQVLEVRLKAIGSKLEVLTYAFGTMLNVLQKQLGSLKLVG